eukprot:scaffold585_cov330-Pavlova_lutheri.AAC.25
MGVRRPYGEDAGTGRGTSVGSPYGEGKATGPGSRGKGTQGGEGIATPRGGGSNGKDFRRKGANSRGIPGGTDPLGPWGIEPRWMDFRLHPPSDLSTTDWPPGHRLLQGGDGGHGAGKISNIARLG